jgi:hypothetical protein
VNFRPAWRSAVCNRLKTLKERIAAASKTAATRMMKTISRPCINFPSPMPKIFQLIHRGEGPPHYSLRRNETPSDVIMHYSYLDFVHIVRQALAPASQYGQSQRYFSMSKRDSDVEKYQAPNTAV